MVLSSLATISEIVPINILITVGSFFLMIPCGWILNTFIKMRGLRLFYSLLLGLAFQYMVYGYSMYHVFIAALINLFIVRNLKKNVGKYATIYNFTHNGLIHLYRLLFEYENWSVEISAIFMMTICKFCAFAYSYEDGLYYLEREKISQNKRDRDVLVEKSHNQKNKYMIKDFTNFEYFCYVYFYPTSICGPFIEFKDFQNFINLKEEFANIPSTVLPSLKRLLHAVIFSVIYFAFKSFGDVDKIIDLNNEYSFLQKAFFFICGLTHQYKYIGGFCFTEAAVIASGFSYNGDIDIKSNDALQKQNHDKWGKVQCIAYFKLISVYDVTNFFHYWNISVHTYLKRYIYTRILPDNADFAQRQLASSRTFLVSAIWHGFHPTYFLVFGHFFLYTLIDKHLKGILKLLKIEKLPAEKFFIYILRIIILFFLVPYHCLMFVCLDHHKLFMFVKSIYYFGVYLALVPNIFLYIVTIILKKSRKKEGKKE
jgi:lysophospholipid acyltransferase